MKKLTLYSEVSYLLGIVTLAVGTAFMKLADLGLSMVVAPPYILHLKISEYLPFFSFGMSAYCFQAVLLIVLSLILKRFRITYLFSFLTAVTYGVVLDAVLPVISLLAVNGMGGRILFYAIGMLFCSLGVAFYFHTYLSPEAYDLFVKEVSKHFKKDIRKVKTIYDCSSCLFAVVLSFIFFGLWHFEGAKIGTIVCALINGSIIGLFGKLFDRIFVFKDAFKFRKFFETEN